MGFLNKIKLDSLKETLDSSVKAAQEGLSNIDVDGVIQNAKSAASSGLSVLDGAIKHASSNDEGAKQEPAASGFIALLWCLAYADGVVSAEEREMLEEIAKSLDEDYESYAADLEREYSQKIREASMEFGSANGPKIVAQRLVESADMPAGAAKLLCWNLLAIANSDSLEECELNLIRFVSEKSGLDPAAFQELKNYSDAIVEIEQARESLKESGRSYGEIEPLVNEFTKREQTIVEAAQALVNDK